MGCTELTCRSCPKGLTQPVFSVGQAQIAILWAVHPQALPTMGA